MALTDKFNLHFNVDDAYNAFVGLDRRQQILAGAGIAAVILTLILIVVVWFSSTLGQSRKDYEDHVQDASRLVGIAAQYEALKNSFEHVESSLSKLGEDPLSSILYKMAEESGVKKTSMVMSTASLPKGESPDFQEIGKDVTLQNVQFDQLVNLLDKISRYEGLPLSVKKLVLKPDISRKHIMHQATFTVTTVRPVKG